MKTQAFAIATVAAAYGSERAQLVGFNTTRHGQRVIHYRWENAHCPHTWIEPDAAYQFALARPERFADVRVGLPYASKRAQREGALAVMHALGLICDPNTLIQTAE